MAKRIVGNDKELLKALKNGKVTKEQDEELMNLFFEDDEFRGMQLNLITMFTPQFSFISELEREDQIELLKKMSVAGATGDLSAFMEIILSNEQARAAFIDLLGFPGFKNLSRQQQD